MKAERRFSQKGYRGVELQITPKAGPDSANVRIVVLLIETAKGRTTLICKTIRKNSGKGLAQCRAIRTSITIPQ
jgi:hypothetical protein